MGNDQEYEGEKEQPVPHPPASDMPIDTQQLPVDQLDHGSPSRPVPMDKDEPIPSENGNLPSQAEAVHNDNNMELKCSTVESHSEAPSSHNSLESRSSLQQSETEAVLSDNKFGKPHESQIEAVPNNKSAELKNNAQQPVIESVLEDNGATATIQQSQQKRVFINNNVQMNSGTQQSQTGAVPNVENVELEASPQNPEIEMSPNANGVDLKANLKQRQTEAAPSYNNVELKSGPQKLLQGSPSSVPLDDGGSLLNPESQSPTLQIPKASETYNCRSKTYEVDCSSISTSHIETDKPPADAKIEPSEVPESTPSRHANTLLEERSEPDTPHAGSSSIKSELETKKELKDVMNKTDTVTPASNGNSSSKQSFLFDEDNEGSESGTEEEQWEFMKELENFFRERSMEFKPPKFYGEGLNCLKLWRAVMKLGGYDKVTSCKLWRQVGESFRPPKTCTTVSWTFRGFYEKALLEYERHKTHGGELNVPLASSSEPMNVDNQGSASGRARRDAAARAMQGWHSQRLLGNGEVSDPIIKDKNSTSLQKREKQLKSLGLLKRKKPSDMEDAVKAARTKSSKSQLDVEVVDLGPPADWVKINVQRTKDCFEVYALVPGLLREEVRVQSDPAGRLVIRGDPEHPDNPWGVTPFKKVVSLPSRIDPHQTSAVVTLHGQLFIRVPFELSD